MPQPKDFTDEAKARRKSKMISAIFCLLTAVIGIQAQTVEWKYIARSEEGRYFVKPNIDSLPGGNSGMWFKILADDGAEQLSYAEWDCRGRRFRLKQTSSFAPDGTAVEQLKNLDWAYVVPETVSEDLISEACGNPRKVEYAVIVLKEVKLRNAPKTSGRVYRTAKRNESFPLAPFNLAGAWYQIYDPVTPAEYWIHGNGIKIVSGNLKSSHLKRQPKKNRADNNPGFPIIHLPITPIMRTNSHNLMLEMIPTESAENDNASADLYKILPRFLSEIGHYSKGQIPNPIERAVHLNGETFQFFIMPAAVTDETEEDGQYNYCFPGVPEALVESVIIELAALDQDFFFDGGKKFAFKLGQIQNQLTAQGFHFSRQQIERSIRILAGAAYMMVGKDTQWIFRTIETLAVQDEEDDVKFLAFLGDITSERIRRHKLHQT